jgi:hypothetical protein
MDEFELNISASLQGNLEFSRDEKDADSGKETEDEDD